MAEAAPEPQHQLPLTKPLVAGEDPESTDVRRLDPGRVRLWRSESGHLRMELKEERTILHVKVACAFPLSNPERYIGFRDVLDVDVGMIVNPRELDPDSLTLVKEELKKRYFVPVITH
ncbi:MAG: DUF1854 domain-containing protein, partial [Armatimonadota bacterium]